MDDLLELIAGRPELGEPLDGADDYLAAEIVYAVSHEVDHYLRRVEAERQSQLKLRTRKPTRPG